MNELEEVIEQWTALSASGEPLVADKFYEEKIFPTVLSRFQASNDIHRSNELLISLLGFSPEPIILTAAAIKPSHHTVVTTEGKIGETEKIERFLNDQFSTVTLADTDFLTIYASLKEILHNFPTQNITIDITGGKKSMVAAASIFGKDYGCRVVYVDFTEYIQRLRKPKPGTEKLTIVYDPDLHQPELKIS